MIILSDDLLLSEIEAEVDGATVDNPVIGWHNVVTIENVSADSENTLYPATNVANPSTYLRWLSDSLSTQYLTVTLSEEEGEVNYVALARHNFGSGNVTVSVEVLGDSGWEEVNAAVALPDDRPALFRFARGLYSGVRLKMIPSTDEPTVSVVYVGELLVLQRRVYVGHSPLTHAKTSNVLTGKSESGEFLGRIVLSEGASSSVEMQNLTASWYREHMTPFVENSKEYPFFFAWRPGTYPLETGYAWLTNDPRMVNQRSNGMVQTQLQMEGIS